MINPTKHDIGRAVVYQGHNVREDGAITSFNKHVVFVRYTAIGGGVPTDRKDLTWLSGKDKDDPANDD